MYISRQRKERNRMLKIALVCQHGASTGICVEKMKQAAAKDNIECIIAAYPDSEMGTLVQLADCILLGPQVGFKKNTFIEKYPEAAERIMVIPAMDFGMMNGEKILKDALNLIEGGKSNG